MVFTRKFSEFPSGGDIQPPDMPVGLEGNVNTIWDYVASGGAASVATTITQANAFTVFQAIRVNNAGTYVLALADTGQNSQVVGVVTNSTGTAFTVQQSGYIDSASGILAGLTPGGVYFLDPLVPGQLTLMDVAVVGQVSRPVFLADSATSGWVLPERPMYAGGTVVSGGSSSGGGGNQTTVTQTAHGLTQGQAIRATTPVGIQERYVTAQANSFANSLAVGFVVQVIDADQFIYQTGGYILNNGTQGGPTVDDAAAALVPGTPYYLSATVAGAITSLEPTNPNYSRPMFMPTQTAGTTGTDAGVIWEERSLLQGGSPPPVNPEIEDTHADMPIVVTTPGWVDIGLCVAITTDNAADRVLINFKLNADSDGQNGFGYRITRNGTPIDIGAASGVKTQASGAGHGTQTRVDSDMAINECFLDSPGAAGIFTYCVEVNRGNSSGVWINRGSQEVDNANYFRTASTIVAMIIN